MPKRDGVANSSPSRRAATIRHVIATSGKPVGAVQRDRSKHWSVGMIEPTCGKTAQHVEYAAIPTTNESTLDTLAAVHEFLRVAKICARRRSSHPDTRNIRRRPQMQRQTVNTQPQTATHTGQTSSACDQAATYLAQMCRDLHLRRLPRLSGQKS